MTNQTKPQDPGKTFSRPGRHSSAKFRAATPHLSDVASAKSEPTPQPQGFMHPQTDEELYWQACWTEQKRETEDVRQQRDELLTALKAAYAFKKGDPNGIGWDKQARAAIARAEEGK